jgi:hypothetical protein
MFPLSSVSRPALRPTQPPVQWVPGVLSPGVKCGRGLTLTTHPHLVPRSRPSRSYTSSPPKRLHGVYWNIFNFICSLFYDTSSVTKSIQRRKLLYYFYPRGLLLGWGEAMTLELRPLTAHLSIPRMIQE